MPAQHDLETSSSNKNATHKKILFMGMWKKYKTDTELKKFLCPDGVINYIELSLSDVIIKRQKPDLFICGTMQTNKIYAFLKKYKKHLAAVPKLLLNWENPDNHLRRTYLRLCMGLVNYVVDFVKHTDLPQDIVSIQFPMWLWFNPDGFEWTTDNNPVARVLKGWTNYNQNTAFLGSCVASHDRFNTRLPIISELQKYGAVKCPGKLIGNSPEIAPGYESKINFISQGRFNICTENSSGKGYFTEKIYNALEAGCTPIYWCGGNQRPIWVNPDAYVYLHDLTPDVIKTNISHAMNVSRPQNILSNPFTPTAKWEIADCFYQLNFLFRRPILFDKPLPEIIHITSPQDLLTEFNKYPLGTQFEWSTGVEEPTHKLSSEWRYLGWRGIEVPGIDISTIPITNMFSEICKCVNGIIHKNYFMIYLLETYSLTIKNE